MITFRREHLDRNLENSFHLMKGRVLDIGGVRENKRGRFRPPTAGVTSWKYLNSDAAANPDYCCSAEKIPLDSRSVNTIIMTEVLEYLESPNKVLAEIFRVLSEDGVALISVPFLHAVHGDWENDRQRFTSAKIKEMALVAGFDLVDVRTMGGLGAVIYDLIHVAGGYANAEKQSLAVSILSKISKLIAPFFQMIDTITEHGQGYITTGYFVVLQKKQSLK